eukprot:TRINITY_DN34511_c0_g1_i1.p1 TRINITY_DN34511_c0_g1~~TRINITY_DN34511_c0_g1_i1.p1  ORF type:complete len:211 (+),score=49.40 TRINITY_DN34511_c0_g1_i1:67-699(+)
MGAGASAGADAALMGASMDEVREAINKLPDADKRKLEAVLSNADSVPTQEASAEMPADEFERLRCAAAESIPPIDPDEIGELTEMMVAPAFLEDVVVIVMHLLAGVHDAVDVSDGKPSAPNWESGKKMMSAGNFIEQLEAFPRKIEDGAIPGTNMREARALAKKLGDEFCIAAVSKVCSPMVTLVCWAEQVLMYSDVMAKAPKDWTKPKA